MCIDLSGMIMVHGPATYCTLNTFNYKKADGHVTTMQPISSITVLEFSALKINVLKKKLKELLIELPLRLQHLS